MKYRNPFKVFIYSLITLGIYDLYWLVKTKAVLNKETDYHTPTLWLLVAPAIILIIAYVGLFAGGNWTNTTNSNPVNYTYNSGPLTSNNNGTLTHPAIFIASIILIIIGWISFIVISFFWFFRYSKAVNQYTNGKMSTAVTFLILWLIHLIGVALVQDAFNEMHGTKGMPPPQLHTPHTA